MLVLCQNCTPKGIPINIVEHFTSSDSLIVAMAILDDWPCNEAKEVTLKWHHRSKGLFFQHHAKIHFHQDVSKHRLSFFLKMSFLEYQKLYGNIKVDLYINDSLFNSKNFTVTNTSTFLYGKNNMNHGYSKSINTLLNVNA